MKKRIVCIHGFGGSAREYAPLTSHLKKKWTYDFYGFTYKERFGTKSLKDIAKEFGGFITKNCGDEGDGDLCLIGFSQGGVIAAYWLEFLEGKRMCGDCIAICSPFHGAYPAYLLELDGFKELRPGSGFLSALLKRMEKSAVNYYTVWNPLDLIVIPGKSGHLDFSRRTKEVRALTHPETFSHPATKRFVSDVIGRRG